MDDFNPTGGTLNSLPIDPTGRINADQDQNTVMHPIVAAAEASQPLSAPQPTSPPAPTAGPASETPDTAGVTQDTTLPASPFNPRDLSQYVKVSSSLTTGSSDHSIDLLTPQFSGALGSAFKAMPPELRSAIQIEQGGRSTAYQARLYQNYLRGGPLAARPGFSKHEKGEAVDLGPTSGSERDPNFQAALKWLYDHGEQYGIRNPQSIRGRDSGHFQFFTPPGAPINDKTDIPYEVRSSIDAAASKYGLDNRMLYSIAKQESDYGRNASASTSSARGLFQITDDTWSYLVNKYGKNFPNITNWDRDNPRDNALMAGALIKENTDILRSKLGREPTAGEIYGAHFMGASGYSRFVDYMNNDPHAPAYEGVSRAAVASNRSVFFNKDGSAKTAAEVYDWLGQKASAAPGLDAHNEVTKTIIAHASEAPLLLSTTPAERAAFNGKPTAATQAADAAVADAQAYAEKGRMLASNVNTSQNGVAASGDIGYRRVDPEEIYAPPKINSTDISRETEARMNHREATASLSTLALDAWNDTNSLAWLFSGAPDMAPDPSFFIDEEMGRKLTEGLDPKYHSYVLHSSSMAQALKARDDALSFQEGEQHLDEAGYLGTGLRVAASFTDPLTLAAFVGTEGVAAPLLFGERTIGYASKFRSALLASGASVASTGVQQLAGDPRVGAGDYVRSAAAGFGLGMLFGKSAKAVAAENEAIMKVAAKIAEDPYASAASKEAIANSSSAGAKQNLDADFLPPKISKDIALLKNEDVWEAGAPKAIPVVGSVDQLMKSSNPVSRLVAPYLGEYAIGFKGHGTIPIAASERAKRLEQSNIAQYAAVYRDAFDAYVKENKGNWLQRSKLRGQFHDEVGDYIRQTDPAIAQQYSEAVKRMGDKQRELQAQLLELARNPGLRQGKELAPLEGADQVSDNKHYLYRVWDQQKLRQTGQQKLTKVLKAAITDAQPTTAKKYIDRLSAGAAESMLSRAHGLEDNFTRALNQGDEESLRAILRDAGLSEEEVQDALKQMSGGKGGEDAGKISRMKRRIILNENWEGYVDGEHVRLKDYLVNDGVHLFRAYNRQMSSRIALAQMQIKDPKTGELLVDGIRSDADFAKLLEQVKAKSVMEKQDARDRAKDIENLQFVYDYMTGRLKVPDAKWADYMRLIQKFNFVRTMNQMGFTQLPELATTISHLGFRASLEHMPELRRLIGMKPEHVQRHGILDEFEAMMGQGTANLRSSMASRLDDEATNGLHSYSKGTTFDKVEAGLENLQHVTSKISLINGVTDMLQNWNAKIVAQSFVNIASGAKIAEDGSVILGKANMRRLGSLGMDEAMLKRVVKQINKHVETTPGIYNAKKMKVMHFDKWTDLEARDAFENTMFRASRRMIQENDVGQMHRWMSHPMARLFMQFRTFTTAAWSKQLLHNLHMSGVFGGGFDAENAMQAFVYFSSALVMGSAAYIAQEKMKALGRSDAEDYLAERMTPEKIAAAAVQRAGWSSVIPMVIDSAQLPQFFGGDPLFSTRSSGLETGIFGNPTTSFFSQAIKAGVDTSKAVRERRLPTQKEARNQESLLPFQNAFLWQQLFNHMISGLDEDNK